MAGSPRPENQDELAAPHSITSSARASTLGGTSRPSALAVLRLIASSYFVGVCTGRFDGGSPLRMRSTYPAARRYCSTVSGPIRNQAAFGHEKSIRIYCGQPVSRRQG